ncbi:MAG: asparaginase [Micavibrio sp.]|nr:asparaginase [Micavibrio sp.]
MPPRKPAARADALTVSITRGPAIESTHIVHALVMDGQENVIAAHGDAARLTFPRSAIKPLQAIALLETGAAAAFNLSNAEIALACASHSGEPQHVDVVSAWLARLGLDETALECGAHAPYATPCNPAGILCNNCSGKHAGMLTLALHMKAPLQGYTRPDHPVQQKILAVMSDMFGAELTPAICGIDGCSAPNPAMPLQSMATGFARLMNPQNLGMFRGTACRHILQAMGEYPTLVGGTKRLDTALIAASSGGIISKVGAEGVYACVIPARNAVIVLKAEDGAGRAAQAALYTLLERHALADAAVLEAIRPLALPAQKNWRGLEVGGIRVEG